MVHEIVRLVFNSLVIQESVHENVFDSPLMYIYEVNESMDQSFIFFHWNSESKVLTSENKPLSLTLFLLAVDFTRNSDALTF